MERSEHIDPTVTPRHDFWHRGARGSLAGADMSTDAPPPGTDPAEQSQADIPSSACELLSDPAWRGRAPREHVRRGRSDEVPFRSERVARTAGLLQSCLRLSV